MKAKVLIHAEVGFLIGMILGNLITWLSGGCVVSPLVIERIGSKTGAIIIQTLISGFYGMVAVGGMSLYDVENWSLAKATIIHYLIISVLYVPMALFLGWAESAFDILIVEGCQLIAFILIWVIMYMRYKTGIRKLNEIVKGKRMR